MPELKNIHELEAYRKQIKEDSQTQQKSVVICYGTGCLALGSDNTIKALEEAIEKKI